MVTAKDITQLLAVRHAKDVFVSECKTGRSSGHGCRRLDGWAMKKSWTTPVAYGYEVKVSRSDFLRDDKWTDYLECCTDFYFVCPSGMISPEEVGGDAGLIWVAKTGTRLFTKKKAPRRLIELSEDLYRYILMWRTSVTREHSTDRMVERRAWIAEKAEKRRLGHLVNGAIREVTNRVSRENDQLASRCAKAAEVEAMMKRLGIDTGWSPANQLRRLFEGEEKREIVDGLNKLRRQIDEVTQRLEDGHQ